MSTTEAEVASRTAEEYEQAAVDNAGAANGADHRTAAGRLAAAQVYATLAMSARISELTATLREQGSQ